MKSAIVAALAIAIAVPALGQPVPCNSRDHVLKLLTGKYSEAVRMEGLGQGGIFEVWSSDAGSWTITVTTPDGQTCMIASGQAFAAIPVGQPL